MNGTMSPKSVLKFLSTMYCFIYSSRTIWDFSDRTVEYKYAFFKVSDSRFFNIKDQDLFVLGICLSWLL